MKTYTFSDDRLEIKAPTKTAAVELMARQILEYQKTGTIVLATEGFTLIATSEVVVDDFGKAAPYCSHTIVPPDFSGRRHWSVSRQGNCHDAIEDGLVHLAQYLSDTGRFSWDEIRAKVVRLGDTILNERRNARVYERVLNYGLMAEEAKSAKEATR